MNLPDLGTFSWPGGGGGSGAAIYPNVAAFPVTATTGSLAVDASTGNLYEFNGTIWQQIAGPNSAVSLGNFDSEASSPKGANLVGGVLAMQSATGTNPGLVNVGAQTFAGVKNFSSNIFAANLSGTNSGDVTIGTANGLSLTGSSQVLNLALSSASTTGSLSSADWNTFNNKQSALTIGNLTDAGTDGITIANGTGSVIGTGTSLSQHVADTTHNGYLSSTDWNTFNGKGSGTVTGTGASGEVSYWNGTGSLAGSSTFNFTGTALGLGTASPNSFFDITTNSLGTTQTNTSGLLLSNNTASALGAQQISPAIRFRAHGWGTTGSADQTLDWQVYSSPTQATNPTSTLTFSHSLNGAGYTTPLSISSNGVLTSSGNLMYGGFLSGNVVSTNSNLLVTSPSSATSETLTQYLFNSATTIFTRSAFYGNTSTALTIGAAYGSVIVGRAPINTAGSSTHSMLANLVVTPLGTVTSGGAAVTNTASLYIDGAGTGGTTNSALYVNGGSSFFGGAVSVPANNFANTALAQMPTLTLKGNNSGGTANASDLTVAQVNTMLGSLSNPMTTLGDIIYENATPAPARLAGNTTATINFLTQTGTGSGSAAPTWTALVAPTQQILSSSGTYTLPTSPRKPLYIRVRAIGPGGGGAGSGSTGQTAGSAGSAATTFSIGSISAGPGSGGNIYQGIGGASNTGGTGSITTGTGITGFAVGGSACPAPGVANSGPVPGASGPLGGGGASGQSGANGYGAGGACGTGSVGTATPGYGGASGAYVEATISGAALANATVVIGAGGAAGTAGTGGTNAQSGASGVVIVDEYYQ